MKGYDCSIVQKKKKTLKSVSSICKRTFITFIILSHAAPLFAVIVWDGKIVPAWPKQHLASLRKAAKTTTAQSAGFGFFAHPKDTTYGLTMIVDFSDQVANFTAAQVSDWLNKPGFSLGGTNGSVRDYYYQVSNGKFLLINDVVGYYRAKNPKSYYEAAGSGYARAGELVNEVITYFDPTVNFAKYDNNKDGITEAISIVYAGSGQTWGQGLWPHSGYINQTKDGVRIGNYNMCDMGPNLGIYVFCHECGHMIFGWPDLYWFGDYCLMGNRMSDANPVPINDFFRADQGWIPTIEIEQSTNARYKIQLNDTGYSYVNPANACQMYYWTNIKNSARYASLRGKGILLYRYDDGISGNTSATSRCLYVVEADGNNTMAAAQWPNPGSATTDFFYSPNRSEFSSITTPAASWGLKMYAISAIADTMQFSVGTGAISSCEPVTAPFAPIMKAARPITCDFLGRCIENPYLTKGMNSSPLASSAVILRKSSGAKVLRKVH